MSPYVFAKVFAAPFSVNGTSNLVHTTVGTLRHVKFTYIEIYVFLCCVKRRNSCFGDALELLVIQMCFLFVINLLERLLYSYKETFMVIFYNSIMYCSSVLDILRNENTIEKEIHRNCLLLV